MPLFIQKVLTDALVRTSGTSIRFQAILVLKPNRAAGNLLFLAPRRGDPVRTGIGNQLAFVLPVVFHDRQ